MKPERLTLNAGQLEGLKIIKGVDRGRYALETMQARPEGVVFTDGRRLVVLPYSDARHAPKKPVLIAQSFLKTVKGWLKRKFKGRFFGFGDRDGTGNSKVDLDPEEHVDVKVWRARAHGTFRRADGRHRLTLRDDNPMLRDAQYPAWQKVLPTEDPVALVSVDVDYLIELAQVMQPFVGGDRSIQLRIQPLAEKGGENCLTVVTKTGAYGLLMPIEAGKFPDPKFKED